MLTDHFHYHTVYVQLIGFGAIVFGVAVFQINNRRKMLFAQICSALLWTMHFLLLGAFTGSAMNLLIAGRSYTFYKIGKKRDIRVPLAVSLAFIIGAILTWQGPRSLLPLAGTTIGTISFWQIKTSRIRSIALLGPCCWFAYNLLSRSYAGMTADTLVFSSIAIGIFRFDLKPRLLKLRKPALAAASAKR